MRRHAARRRPFALTGVALAAVLLLAILSPGCSSLRARPPGGQVRTPSAASTPSPAPPTPAAPPPPAPAPAPTPPPPPPVPPSPQVSIAPSQVLQGDFTTLSIEHPTDDDAAIRVQGLSEQPRLFALDGRLVAFIGFPSDAKVGLYPVTVTWPGGSWQGRVEVIRKKFTEDRLTVTKEQEDTYYDPRSDQEWARVFALRSRSVPRPLWSGRFRPPLAGALRITTYFGEIRYVNGKETGRHSGMDFGEPTGTPILAPAPGKVILAEKLILTGNTVIIDHGMDLFTAYYHGDTLKVKAGEWVEEGQVIATVGSTGFSTGPHLHWTATIGNTPVDPWPLTEKPPLNYYGDGRGPETPM